MKRNAIFRAISLLLSLLMLASTLMLTVSCAITPPDDNPPEENPPEENPPAEDGPVAIVKDGATEYAIAYDNDFSDASSDLRAHMAVQYDVEVDKYKYKTETRAKEILLGDTNRELSAELKAAVNAANESGEDLVWGYAHKDGKIAFYANCEEAIECGWDAFIDAISQTDGMSCDADLWVVGFKYIDEYIVENGLFYKDKVISFMGDSITSFAGYSYEGNLTVYPTDYLKSYKDTYWQKIVDEYGMKLGVNDGYSGARVGWDGVNEVYAGGPMVNADLVMSSQNRIDRLDDNGSPDYIIVYAGTNDYRREPAGSIDDVDWDTLLKEDLTEAERAALPVDNFARSTASMIAGLKMTYPDAHILVLIPTWFKEVAGHQYTNDAQTVKDRVKECGDIYVEVLERFDVDYIDLREMCTFEEKGEFLGGDNLHVGDGLHPNKKGMEKIFEMCKEYYDQYALDSIK